jgi:hypothetical protein
LRISPMRRAARSLMVTGVVIVKTPIVGARRIYLVTGVS